MAQLVAQGFRNGQDSPVSPSAASFATLDSTYNPYRTSMHSALARARQGSLGTTSESADILSPLRSSRQVNPSSVRSVRSPTTLNSDLPGEPQFTMHTLDTIPSSFQGSTETWLSRGSAVTGLSHIQEQEVDDSYYKDSSSSELSTSLPAANTASTSGHLHSSPFSSSIIAFNTKDALTNEPLIDPVLGSDGLIHDRWSLIDRSDEITQNVTMYVIERD